MRNCINYQLIWIITIWSSTQYVFSKTVTLLDTKKDGWDSWKKNTDNTVGWRKQNLPPDGDLVYGVCEIQQSKSTNSWLRSPFIKKKFGTVLQVRVSFTMRKCEDEPDPAFPPMFHPANCNETFVLLKYESDLDTNDIEYNNRFFSVVKTVKPNKKWRNKDRTEDILNQYIFNVPVSRSGVILAFPNTGSCVMLKEVNVFYNECEDKTIKLVNFKRTASKEIKQRIMGSCVIGGQMNLNVYDHRKNSLLYGYCHSDGKWQIGNIPDVCECAAGYEPNLDLTQCTKCRYEYYKFKSGMDKCQSCPENSDSSDDSTRCFCKRDYYNVASDSRMLDCRLPPAKPTSIATETKDQARVKLVWSASPDQAIAGTNGERFHYNISCINCPNQLVFQPSSITLDNSVTILGTLPSKEYQFKVTSVNKVSQFVTTPFDIEQSSRKIIILTNPLEREPRVIIESMIKHNNKINVKWKLKTPFIDPSKIIEYECVLMGFRSYPDDFSIRFPQYQLYKFTNDQNVQFNLQDIPANILIAKVRARNENGWAIFSDTANITNLSEKYQEKNKNKPIYPSSSSSSSASSNKINNKKKFTFSLFTETSKLPFNKKVTTQNSIIQSPDSPPKKDIILLIVGSILLLIVLLAVGAVVIFCMRRQILFVDYRHKNKKMKCIESHLNNQVTYSSAYSLPRHTGIKYQDPGTYEDISIALNDFTKDLESDWILTENLIHRGEIVEVWKGKLKMPNELERIVAIKILNEEANEKQRNDFFLEASTVGQFRHENILKLEGCIHNCNPCTVVIEYMARGNLLSYLQVNRKQISLMTQIQMMRDIANGMKYLSNIGFIHRDLAARNVLVSSSLVCKIGDFGLSRRISSKDDVYSFKNESRISVKWSSPEAVLYGTFSSASDVWSYGVVGWEILSFGDHPYWQWDDDVVLDAIQSGYRLPPPTDCPITLQSLLLYCWAQRPEQRITFPIICNELCRMMTVLVSGNCNTMNPNNSSINGGSETAQLLLHCGDQVPNNYPHQMCPQAPLPPLPINDQTINSSIMISSASAVFPRRNNSSVQPDFNTISASKINVNSNPMNIFNHYPNNTNKVANYYQYQMSTTSHLDLIPSPPPHYSGPSPVHLPTTANSTPHPQITPNHHTTIDQLLARINLDRYTGLFLRHGLRYTHQIQCFNSDRLKMIGIKSKVDRKSIICALQPLIYC